MINNCLLLHINTHFTHNLTSDFAELGRINLLSAENGADCDSGTF